MQVSGIHFAKVSTGLVLFLIFSFSASFSCQHFENSGLPAPTLTSPVNNTTWTQNLYPTFQWQAVTGASSYTIHISRSNTDFSGSNLVKSATVYNAYYMIDTALSNCTSYYWRVRASDSGGVGSWSSVWKVTVHVPPSQPVLTTPASGAVLTQRRPMFTWEASISAPAYTIEIDGRTYSVSATTFTPYSSLGHFTFTVQTGEGLLAPQLQSPLNGSTVDFPLTLQWSSVTGAYTYTLAYSRDSDFTDAVSVTLFGTEYFIPSALEWGKWYWHVRANTSQGESGPWSTSWSFVVGLPVPQLLSPPNGASQGTSTINFDWSDVTGSQIGGELYDLDHYVLQYSTSSAFESQNAITIDEVAGLPLRDSRYGPINLGYGTYYWRVKAVYIKYPEGTLREGSWSPSYSFSIITGGVAIPSLVSPVSGSVMKGTSVTLVWNPVESSSITGYVLVYLMGKSINLGNPSQWAQGSYTEVIIPGKSTSSYTITLTENTLQNPYYWWSIATVNSSGQKGTFPSPINFSIDNTPPNISAVELVQPVNTTLETRIPTFTWTIPLTDYQDVTSWTLEYASDTQLQQNRRTITGLTSLSTIISGDKASISYKLTSSQALTNGTWYWHISATDAAGNQSAFTSVTRFTIGDQESGEIELTVNVSNINGDPISGATVKLTKDSETKGTTDTSGSITISNLEEGTYTLEVSAAGYNTHTESVNLSANTTKDITLYRGALIHGYVYYDTTKNPAPNVTVRVYETETQLQVVSDITDMEGYFIVDNITENKTYYIIVRNYEDQKKQGILPVDTPTTANALTIIVKTEGEIIGVVQDDGGAPLPGAKITLRDDQGQFVNSTSTSNIGSFTFKVTPGKYYVEVTLPGYEYYKGDIFTVEYKEVEDLGLITLSSKTGTLAVTVQSVDGDPLDATITVKDAAGNSVESISVTGGYASVEIPTDLYTLEADAENYNPQVATNILIESGTTVSQSFILSPAPGTIKMYISGTGGLPISNAQVLLDGDFEGTTDQNGTLVINNVSPKDYTISVIKKDYADYTEIQKVGPNETLIVDIKMEKTSSVWQYILIAVLVIGIGIALLRLKLNLTASKRKTKKIPSHIMYCPYCRNRIRKNLDKCPYCGKNLDETRIYDEKTRIY